MASVTSEPEVEVLVESEKEPNESATPLEMIMPPLALIVLILLGLIGLSCVSQKYFWKKLCSRKTDKAAEVASLSSVNISVTSSPSRWTSANQSVIQDFRSFFNQPHYLLQLALPALLSLALCPVTLFMYKPMVELFWPSDQFPVPPEINDVIACFLTPAGLVYAIAFGFAFQDAQSKQQLVCQHLCTQLMLLEQISMLSLIAPQLQPSHKLSMLNTLKQYTLNTMKDIMGHKRSSANEMLQDGVCSGLKMITQVKADVNDVGLLPKITDLLLELDALSTKGLDQISAAMHVVQWLFLELLGFFSFFGVLLLHADSYRLELTMCVLTVFSIAAFCYVLADLDNPFHGAFRVDTTGLVTALYSMEQVQGQMQLKVNMLVKGQVQEQVQEQVQGQVQRQVTGQMQKSSQVEGDVELELTEYHLH